MAHAEDSTSAALGYMDVGYEIGRAGGTYDPLLSMMDADRWLDDFGKRARQRFARGFAVGVFMHQKVTAKCVADFCGVTCEPSEADPEVMASWSPAQRNWWRAFHAYRGLIECVKCGNIVPDGRRPPGYAVPTCHVCLPPPPELEEFDA